MFKLLTVTTGFIYASGCATGAELNWQVTMGLHVLFVLSGLSKWEISKVVTRYLFDIYSFLLDFINIKWLHSTSISLVCFPLDI